RAGPRRVTPGPSGGGTAAGPGSQRVPRPADHRPRPAPLRYAGPRTAGLDPTSPVHARAPVCAGAAGGDRPQGDPSRLRVYGPRPAVEATSEYEGGTGGRGGREPAGRRALPASGGSAVTGPCR